MVDLALMTDLVDDYVEVCERAWANGAPVTVRNQLTRELRDVTLHWEQLTAALLPLGVGRQVNPRFAAVEALSLVAGTCRPDLLALASPGYGDVLVDARAGAQTEVAYGPRTWLQVRRAVKLLRTDPTSRQAVLQIWRDRDLLNDAPGDRPCTLNLQLLVRDGELHLTSSMRSQDAWLGLAYDAFMFSQLAMSLCRELGLRPGSFTHHATSLHLYERDAARIKGLHLSPLSKLGPDDDLDKVPLYRRLLQLPLGVRPGEEGDPEFNSAEVARALLTGTATAAECQANPWYVKQLARLNVAQLAPVTR